MRSLLLVAVLAVAVPDRPAPPLPVKPQSPEQLLLGDWSDPNNSNLVLRILPGETMFRVNGKDSPGDGLSGSYTIDWTKSPVAIDLKPHQGRGNPWVGILKLEGDQLTLGLRYATEARPIDFSATTLVFRYQRVKK